MFYSSKCVTERSKEGKETGCAGLRITGQFANKPTRGHSSRGLVNTELSVDPIFKTQSNPIQSNVHGQSTF